MSDNVWPGMPTGPNEFEQRDELEQRDRDSLSIEHSEQERIGNEMLDPFAANRVPTPGSGDGEGGRVRVNPEWPK